MAAERAKTRDAEGCSTNPSHNSDEYRCVYLDNLFKVPRHYFRIALSPIFILRGPHTCENIGE